MGIINITPIGAPIPEGWQGDLEEYRQKIFSTLVYEIEGDFLTGQVGGSKPTQDVGIWIDPVTQTIYIWDAASSSYKPTKTEEIGVVKAYLGSTPPPFYLLCNGTLYLKTRYPELFSLIGTAYNRTTGVVDPSDSFRVPDFRGRSPFGSGTGTYNPLATANLLMKDIALHEYGGAEYPIRREPMVVNQPPAVDPPGTSLYYSAAPKAGLYTRSVPPFIGVNWIIRAE